MNTDIPLQLDRSPLYISVRDIVAKAAQTLPSLTRAQDEAFILMVTEEVFDAFWNHYLDWQTQAVREELMKAIEENDNDAIEQWFKTYADFGSDLKAASKAQSILQEIETKLPALMNEQYPHFTEEEAFQVS